jgi:hypothetical protein
VGHGALDASHLRLEGGGLVVCYPRLPLADDTIARDEQALRDLDRCT